jgi:hypothetical protein
MPAIIAIRQSIYRWNLVLSSMSATQCFHFRSRKNNDRTENHETEDNGRTVGSLPKQMTTSAVEYGLETDRENRPILRPYELGPIVSVGQTMFRCWLRHITSHNNNNPKIDVTCYSSTTKNKYENQRPPKSRHDSHNNLSPGPGSNAGRPRCCGPRCSRRCRRAWISSWLGRAEPGRNTGHDRLVSSPPGIQ